MEQARSIIEKHAAQNGAALPILHALQEHFGYVPENVLPVVAHVLNVTRAEIYGVATFYHDFRLAPSGAHRLTLCRAEACQAMGGAALEAQAKSRLGVEWGETTPDGRVTLDQTFCLGLCACAPSAMLDGKIYGRLNAQKLDALIEEAA
ncbi:MAG: formate dehydrogenase subunit gamma [Hyphomicrobiales bacterium]|nr:formate dehydrogenase subunit gamma [Hyphomicrobiales bacterium]